MPARPESCWSHASTLASDWTTASVDNLTVQWQFLLSGQKWQTEGHDIGLNRSALLFITVVP